MTVNERAKAWLKDHSSKLYRLLWLILAIVPFEFLRVAVSSNVHMSHDSDSDIGDPVGSIFSPMHDWLKTHETTMQFFAALPLLIHFLCHILLLVVFFEVNMWVGFEFLLGQVGTILFQSIMQFPLPSTAILYSKHFFYFNETPGMDVTINWHFFVGFLATLHAVKAYDRRLVKIFFAMHGIFILMLTMSCRTTYTWSCVLSVVVFAASLTIERALQQWLDSNNLEIDKKDKEKAKKRKDKAALRASEQALRAQRQHEIASTGQNPEDLEVGHDMQPEERDELSDEIEMDDVSTDIVSMLKEEEAGDEKSDV